MLSHCCATNGGRFFTSCPIFGAQLSRSTEVAQQLLGLSESEWNKRKYLCDGDATVVEESVKGRLGEDGGGAIALHRSVAQRRGPLAAVCCSRQVSQIDSRLH